MVAVAKLSLVILTRGSGLLNLKNAVGVMYYYESADWYKILFENGRFGGKEKNCGFSSLFINIGVWSALVPHHVGKLP